MKFWRVFKINNSLTKSIISTDYSEIESHAHIEEILSCHSTLDESTAKSLHFDRDNFTSVLDSYLKKRHAEVKDGSKCLCRKKPIFKSESKIIEYFSGADHVAKNLCEKCGYVFSETTNRQMTTY